MKREKKWNFKYFRWQVTKENYNHVHADGTKAKNVERQTLCVSFLSWISAITKKDFRPSLSLASIFFLSHKIRRLSFSRGPTLFFPLFLLYTIFCTVFWCLGKFGWKIQYAVVKSAQGYWLIKRKVKIQFFSFAKSSFSLFDDFSRDFQRAIATGSLSRRQAHVPRVPPPTTRIGDPWKQKILRRIIFHWILIFLENATKCIFLQPEKTFSSSVVAEFSKLGLEISNSWWKHEFNWGILLPQGKLKFNTSCKKIEKKMTHLYETSWRECIFFQFQQRPVHSSSHVALQLPISHFRSSSSVTGRGKGRRNELETLRAIFSWLIENFGLTWENPQVCAWCHVPHTLFELVIDSI